ncbi:hypothetical protein SH528x_006960 [Novipirellula sp. SH528]|uniref:hypothetical protein n=1 Tax=Novipirellula sp. SH528 TaxID=3454466 RepID=UPI003FA184E0
MPLRGYARASGKAGVCLATYLTQKQGLAKAINRMLADPDEPYLLDVTVEAEENVYPMIPEVFTYKDIIMGPEDLTQRAGENQGSNI